MTSRAGGVLGPAPFAAQPCCCSVVSAACDAVLVFDAEARESLRARLIRAARSDERIVGAALLGSAARAEADRWSDIDLALRLAPGADVELVAETWAARVGETEVVVDHLDIRASGALYRVLLLGSTLQVDLSFWPHDQPLAPGSPVEVLFGQVPVAPAQSAEPVDGAMGEVRLGWLYAVHARSALRRGRVWQAMWMLEAIRNVVVGLYCRRFELPAGEGRGVDRLPAELLTGLAASVPVGTDAHDLWCTFEALAGLLLTEAEHQGLPVPHGLAGVLEELSRLEPDAC